MHASGSSAWPALRRSAGAEPLRPSRSPLACRGQGWCAQRLFPVSSPRVLCRAVAFPPVGRLGLPAPPAPGLCAATTAILPVSGRFACRSPPRYLVCPPSFVVSLAGSCRGGKAPTPRQGVWSPGPPCRVDDKETAGSPTFPSSPWEDLPRSQTPVVSCARALPRPLRCASPYYCGDDHGPTQAETDPFQDHTAAALGGRQPP